MSTTTFNYGDQPIILLADRGTQDVYMLSMHEQENEQEEGQGQGSEESPNTTPNTTKFNSGHATEATTPAGGTPRFTSPQARPRSETEGQLLMPVHKREKSAGASTQPKRDSGTVRATPVYIKTQGRLSQLTKEKLPEGLNEPESGANPELLASTRLNSSPPAALRGMNGMEGLTVSETNLSFQSPFRSSGGTLEEKLAAMTKENMLLKAKNDTLSKVLRSESPSATLRFCKEHEDVIKQLSDKCHDLEKEVISMKASRSDQQQRSLIEAELSALSKCSALEDEVQLIKHRLLFTEQRLQSERSSRSTQLSENEINLLSENCELRARELELKAKLESEQKAVGDVGRKLLDLRSELRSMQLQIVTDASCTRLQPDLLRALELPPGADGEEEPEQVQAKQNLLLTQVWSELPDGLKQGLMNADQILTSLQLSENMNHKNKDAMKDEALQCLYYRYMMLQKRVKDANEAMQEFNIESIDQLQVMLKEKSDEIEDLNRKINQKEEMLKSAEEAQNCLTNVYQTKFQEQAKKQSELEQALLKAKDEAALAVAEREKAHALLESDRARLLSEAETRIQTVVKELSRNDEIEQQGKIIEGLRSEIQAKDARIGKLEEEISAPLKQLETRTTGVSPLQSLALQETSSTNIFLSQKDSTTGTTPGLGLESPQLPFGSSADLSTRDPKQHAGCVLAESNLKVESAMWMQENIKLAEELERIRKALQEAQEQGCAQAALVQVAEQAHEATRAQLATLEGTVAALSSMPKPELAEQTTMTETEEPEPTDVQKREATLAQMAGPEWTSLEPKLVPEEHVTVDESVQIYPFSISVSTQSDPVSTNSASTQFDPLLLPVPLESQGTQSDDSLTLPETFSEAIQCGPTPDEIQSQSTQTLVETKDSDATNNIGFPEAGASGNAGVLPSETRAFPASARSSLTHSAQSPKPIPDPSSPQAQQDRQRTSSGSSVVSNTSKGSAKKLSSKKPAYFSREPGQPFVLHGPTPLGTLPSLGALMSLGRDVSEGDAREPPSLKLLAVYAMLRHLEPECQPLATVLSGSAPQGSQPPPSTTFDESHLGKKTVSPSQRPHYSSPVRASKGGKGLGKGRGKTKISGTGSSGSEVGSRKTSSGSELDSYRTPSASGVGDFGELLSAPQIETIPESLKTIDAINVKSDSLGRDSVTKARTKPKTRARSRPSNRAENSSRSESSSEGEVMLPNVPALVAARPAPAEFDSAGQSFELEDEDGVPDVPDLTIPRDYKAAAPMSLSDALPPQVAEALGIPLAEADAIHQAHAPSTFAERKKYNAGMQVAPQKAEHTSNTQPVDTMDAFVSSSPPPVTEADVQVNSDSLESDPEHESSNSLRRKLAEQETTLARAQQTALEYKSHLEQLAEELRNTGGVLAQREAELAGLRQLLQTTKEDQETETDISSQMFESGLDSLAASSKFSFHLPGGETASEQETLYDSDTNESASTVQGERTSSADETLELVRQDLSKGDLRSGLLRLGKLRAKLRAQRAEQELAAQSTITQVRREMEATLGEARALITTHEKELDATRLELERQRTRADHEAELAQTQLGELRKRLEQLEEAKVQLQKTLDMTHDSYRAQNEKQQEFMDKLEEDNRRLHGDLEILKEIKGMNESLQKHLANSGGSTDQLRDDNARLRAACENEERARREAAERGNEERARLQEQIAALESRLRSQDEDRAQARNEDERALNERLQQLQNVVQALESELASLRDEKARQLEAKKSVLKDDDVQTEGELPAEVVEEAPSAHRSSLANAAHPHAHAQPGQYLANALPETFSTLSDPNVAEKKDAAVETSEPDVEVAGIQEKYKRLMQDHEDIQGKLHALLTESRIQELEHKITEMQEQLSLSEREKFEAIQKGAARAVELEAQLTHARHEGEVRDLAQQARQQEQVRALEASLHSQQLEWHSIKNELQQRVEKLRDKKRNQKRSIQSALERAQRAERETEQLRAENDDLREKNESAAQYEALLKKYTELQETKAHLENECDELRQAKPPETTEQELRARYDSLITQNTELSESVAEREKACAMYEIQCTQLEIKTSELNKFLGELESRRDALLAQLKELEGRHELLKLEHSTMAEAVDQFRKVIPPARTNSRTQTEIEETLAAPAKGINLESLSVGGAVKPEAKFTNLSQALPQGAKGPEGAQLECAPGIDSLAIHSLSSEEFADLERQETPVIDKLVERHSDLQLQFITQGEKYSELEKKHMALQEKYDSLVKTNEALQASADSRPTTMQPPPVAEEKLKVTPESKKKQVRLLTLDDMGSDAPTSTSEPNVLFAIPAIPESKTPIETQVPGTTPDQARAAESAAITREIVHDFALAKAHVAACEEQEERLRAELENTRRDCAVMLREKQDVHTQLIEARALLEAQRELDARNKRESSELRAEHAKLRAEYEQQLTLAARLQSEAEQQKRNVEELRREGEQYLEVIKQDKTELELERLQTDQVRSQLEKAQSEKMALLRECEESREGIKSAVADAEQREVSMHEQVEQMVHDCNELKAQLAQSLKKQKKAEDRIQKSNEDRALAEKGIEDAKLMAAQREAQFQEEMRSAEDRHKLELRKMAAEQRELEKKTQESKQKLELAQVEFAHTRDQAEELERTNARAEERIAELTQQIELGRAQSAKLEQRVLQLESELHQIVNLELSTVLANERGGSSEGLTPQFALSSSSPTPYFDLVAKHLAERRDLAHASQQENDRTLESRVREERENARRREAEFLENLQRERHERDAEREQERQRGRDREREMSTQLQAAHAAKNEQIEKLLTQIEKAILSGKERAQLNQYIGQLRSRLETINKALLSEKHKHVIAKNHAQRILEENEELRTELISLPKRCLEFFRSSLIYLDKPHTQLVSEMIARSDQQAHMQLEYQNASRGAIPLQSLDSIQNGQPLLAPTRLGQGLLNFPGSPVLLPNVTGAFLPSISIPLAGPYPPADLDSDYSLSRGPGGSVSPYAGMPSTQWHGPGRDRERDPRHSERSDQGARGRMRSTDQYAQAAQERSDRGSSRADRERYDSRSAVESKRQEEAAEMQQHLDRVRQRRVEQDGRAHTPNPNPSPIPSLNPNNGNSTNGEDGYSFLSLNRIPNESRLAQLIGDVSGEGTSQPQSLKDTGTRDYSERRTPEHSLGESMPSRNRTGQAFPMQGAGARGGPVPSAPVPSTRHSREGGFSARLAPMPAS